MTHPPQPILESKPRPMSLASHIAHNIDRLVALAGRRYPLGMWLIPMHPTTRPDNYSSPAYNEWEDDQ